MAEADQPRQNAWLFHKLAGMFAVFAPHSHALDFKRMDPPMLTPTAV
jgi:hypothetical protein